MKYSSLASAAFGGLFAAEHLVEPRRNPHVERYTRRRTRILIVDDDPFTQKMLRLVFERRYTDIEFAGTGAEAIRKTSEGRYDLIVLDWNLPDMTGGGALACASSRIDPDPEVNLSGVNTPVIIYSSCARHEATLAGIQQNFFLLDFWPKTVFPLALREKASDVLDSL